MHGDPAVEHVVNGLVVHPGCQRSATPDLEPHRVLERSRTVPRYTQSGRPVVHESRRQRPSRRTGFSRAPVTVGGLSRSWRSWSGWDPTLEVDVGGGCNASAAASVAFNVGWSVAGRRARAAPLLVGERSAWAVEVGRGALGDRPPASLGFATPGGHRAERRTSSLGPRGLAPAAASAPSLHGDLTPAVGPAPHPSSLARSTRQVTRRAERAVGGPGRTTSA